MSRNTDFDVARLARDGNPRSAENARSRVSENATTLSAECEASRRVTTTRGKSDRILTFLGVQTDGRGTSSKHHTARLSPPKVYRRESTRRDIVTCSLARDAGSSFRDLIRACETWRGCHDRKPLPARLISRALARVTFAAARPTKSASHRKVFDRKQERVARRGEGRGRKGLRDSRASLTSRRYPHVSRPLRQMGS